jgi:exonuclease III
MSGCPPEASHFCSKETLGRGLCVADPAECNVRVSTRPVPRVPDDTLGLSFGYIDAYLGRSCYSKEEDLVTDYSADIGPGDAIPPKFTFLTYNIWGLAHKAENRHLFDLRLPLLAKTLLDADADLCFLQEMSSYAFERLYPLLRHTYPYASEVPYPAEGSTPVAGRNRQVEVYCFSKMKPRRLRVFGIDGVLGYKDSFMIAEFPNLVVFNLYNQAGSRHSPGQEHKWLHYSRCRYDILNTIHDIIRTSYADSNIILCGDFNFDLDGTLEEWPEKEMLDRMGLIDTFRITNPDDPGLTEDTDLNFMRWNQKLIKKKFRYDGIFASRGPWRTKKSELIGTKFKMLNADESEWFITKMSIGSDPTKLITDIDGLIPINPSDHFGVLTTFISVPSPVPAPAGGYRHRTQRLTASKRRSKKLSISWKRK